MTTASDGVAILRTIRRGLILRAAMASLLSAVAVGWLMLTLSALLRPLLPSITEWLNLLVLPAAIGVAGLVLWRHRHARSPLRVALWLEEQIPELQYALVTLVDGSARDSSFSANVARRVESVYRRSAWPAALSPTGVGRHVLRAVAPLAFAAVLAQILLATGWTYGWALSSGAGALRGQRAVVNRIAVLQGELIPPAYTGWPTEALDNPERIGGLVGSQVILRGDGVDAGGIEARIGDEDPLPMESAPQAPGWALGFAMPAEPSGLLLTDGDNRRVIVLEPRPDEAPQVRLTLPEVDAERRETTGELELAASLRDDIGLASGWFEVLVARGPESGDYGFSEERLFQRTFDTAEAELRGATELGNFNLNPGDQISVRAVVQDVNDVTGPGIGYSETRTIRFLRDIPEADVEINPAPPPIDESLMSLRMLIRETERLEARRPELRRAAFLAEVAPLLMHTGNIRVKVQGFVDEASVGGAFNVPELLLFALDEMWEANRQMTIAETDDALVHMRNAYDALMTLFNLTRYFLRGEMLPAHAEVDEVRMTGEEPVHATERSRREREDSVRQQLAAQLDALSGNLDATAEWLDEHVALMQVAALRDLPEAAAALEGLSQALRRGDGLGPALAEARAVLEGPAQIEDGLSGWAPLPGRPE